MGATALLQQFDGAGNVAVFAGVEQTDPSVGIYGWVYSIGRLVSGIGGSTIASLRFHAVIRMGTHDTGPHWSRL